MIVQENKIDRKGFEEKLFELVCQVGTTLYAETLENWDKELHKERDKKIYRDKGKRKTVLKTLMGEVEYSRHVYSFQREDGTKGTIYLLDEAIGKAGSGFFSEALMERIGTSVCELPYRKAAEEISSLTGQSLSHGGVWNATQQLGQQVEALEAENAEKALRNKGSGKTERKLLFEEQDGIYLHLQGKDRKRHGKGKEMKLSIAYDGAKKTGKRRYALTGKVACANFEPARKFQERKEGVIADHYNVDEITTRILNGDGANWIKSNLGDEVTYQLDPYHRNRAILSAAPNAEHRTVMLKLLYEKDIDYLLIYIETLADSMEDAQKEKELRKLYTYFTNNKDGLVGYHHRGLTLPTPPEGLEYRHLGAMESNVFSIIGNRMKSRRKCWSIKGGNNLARLLCLKATGTLRDTISILSSNLPERYAEEILLPLTAAASKESVGTGYNGFDQATISLSLKGLKEIVKLKPLSDLIM